MYYIDIINHTGVCNSVGIATGYEVYGPVIDSRWGDRFFRTCPDRPWGLPRLLYNGEKMKKKRRGRKRSRRRRRRRRGRRKRRRKEP